MTRTHRVALDAGSLVGLVLLALLTVTGCDHAPSQTNPPDGPAVEPRATSTKEKTPAVQPDRRRRQRRRRRREAGAVQRLRRDPGAGMLRPEVAQRSCVRLRAEQRRRHRHGHRPGDVQGRRHVHRRRARAARRALARPRRAVRGGQRGRPPGADRPGDGTPGKPIPIAAPYNLYFTPDGTSAVVMAERLDRIDYYDPTTWALQQSVPVPCRGREPRRLVGRRAVVPRDLRVLGPAPQGRQPDPRHRRHRHPPGGSMPQDIRLTPDGTAFFVADMAHDGVWVVDAESLSVVRLDPHRRRCPRALPEPRRHAASTCRTAAARWVTTSGRSRDGDGSVSVVDPATDTVTATWTDPGRRLARHGRRLGRRQGALAVRSLRRGGLRLRHGDAARCSPASRCRGARTGCACSPSPAATRSGTRATTGDMATASGPGGRHRRSRWAPPCSR